MLYLYPTLLDYDPTVFVNSKHALGMSSLLLTDASPSVDTARYMVSSCMGVELVRRRWAKHALVVETVLVTREQACIMLLAYMGGIMERIHDTLIYTVYKQSRGLHHTRWHRYIKRSVTSRCLRRVHCGYMKQWCWSTCSVPVLKERINDEELCTYCKVADLIEAMNFFYTRPTHWSKNELKLALRVNCRIRCKCMFVGKSSVGSCNIKCACGCVRDCVCMLVCSWRKPLRFAKHDNTNAVLDYK